MVRKSSITSMFAGSPIQPLQKHMDKCCECIAELPKFFRAVAERDFARAEEIQNRISDLEVEADELKQELRMNLPNTLFMPMPREQILDLVRQQDKIANTAKDIAGIMTGRKAEIPEPIAEFFITFVERANEAAIQAQTAINELDELLETGFRGGQITRVNNMISDLDDIEHDTDVIERQLRHALFTIEKDYHPLDMMFLYRVIDWIGKLADVSQRVGARLQLLMAR